MQITDERLKELSTLLEQAIKELSAVEVEIQRTREEVRNGVAAVTRTTHQSPSREREAWVDFTNKMVTPSLYGRIKDPINGRLPR